jgi:hypothetical protein
MSESGSDPGDNLSSQDTALLPPVPRLLRLSVFVLVAACLAAAAFVGGAYLAQPSATETPAPAPSVKTVPQAAPAPTDGYYMGVAPAEKRPPEVLLCVAAGAPKLFYHYALPGWPAPAKLKLRWWLAGIELPADNARWRRDSRAKFATGLFELTPSEPAQTPPPVPPKPPAPAPAPAAPAQGFPQGIYQVEITGPDDLKEVGSFAVLAGLDQMMAQQTPTAAVLITPPVLAAAVDKQSRPTRPLPPNIAPDVPKLFVCFGYQGAAPGTVVEVRWFFYDIEVDAARSQVTLPSAFGQASAWFERHGDPLPEGKWRVAVYLPGAEKPSAELPFAVTPKPAR